MIEKFTRTVNHLPESITGELTKWEGMIGGIASLAIGAELIFTNVGHNEVQKLVEDIAMKPVGIAVAGIGALCITQTMKKIITGHSKQGM